MAKTRLKKLTFKKFRALKDLEIEFATHVTVICGKNGTSKSSILGIAAQIFSFEKDYVKNTGLKFQTITGESFKSLPSEHFRFSDQYDVPGSLDVAVEVHDGYSDAIASAELELANRKLKSGKEIARPVLRKNTSASVGNQSRNFTHPVIYLSLQRLLPIASRVYKTSNFNYLNSNKQKFISLNNELLNKTSSIATGTSGSINSAVAHADTYNQDSVSAGEDNVGQIVLALMSFRKLKQEYNDYKGGLLLIDEADAALFPAAQTKLLEILERECSELDLQVIMTSHSPTLIERTFELSQKFQRKFKTIYLSDTFGAVKVMPDYSWSDIYSDLLTKTVRINNDTSLPKINIYYEDGEAYDFCNAILTRQKCKKYINPVKGVSLGCSNYIQLVQKKVPEFSNKSIIILDGDVSGTQKLNSIVKLPNELPPDQLIFEFLYNLPADDSFWINSINFTRAVFTRCASKIISALNISGNSIDLKPLVETYKNNINDKNERQKKSRELFKNFYKDDDFQALLSQTGMANPWARWVQDNQIECTAFKQRFIKQLVKTMQVGYGVDASKLIAL